MKMRELAVEREKLKESLSAEMKRADVESCEGEFFTAKLVDGGAEGSTIQTAPRPETLS
jgi:hypothetical protein